MDAAAIHSVLEKSMLASSGAPVSSSGVAPSGLASSTEASRRSGSTPPSAGTNAFAVRSSAAAVAAGVQNINAGDVTALKGRDAPRAHGVHVRGSSVVVDVDKDASDEKAPHLEVRCCAVLSLFSFFLSLSLSLSFSLMFMSRESVCDMKCTHVVIIQA